VFGVGSFINEYSDDVKINTFLNINDMNRFHIQICDYLTSVQIAFSMYSTLSNQTSVVGKLSILSSAGIPGC